MYSGSFGRIPEDCFKNEGTSPHESLKSSRNFFRHLEKIKGHKNPPTANGHLYKSIAEFKCPRPR